MTNGSEVMKEILTVIDNGVIRSSIYIGIYYLWVFNISVCQISILKWNLSTSQIISFVCFEVE